MKLPDGLTEEEVEEAAKEQMFGTEDPGFCLACGERREGCEPDAEGYECYDCGAMQVMGAELLLMHIA